MERWYGVFLGKHRNVRGSFRRLSETLDLMLTFPPICLSLSLSSQREEIMGLNRAAVVHNSSGCSNGSSLIEHFEPKNAYFDIGNVEHEVAGCNLGF